ncbi:single-stranded DNA-binding protein [Lysinibacillus sp. 2017]|uniref:single-stranded DNA-binding protein n=1 Tax=unclassified Lysinibacillus TaxID=2636778 RepID=UPI000D5259C2|nr:MULTISPECIES: single-stranded DNA-binding protein [unclassified Lysinibacillus]AWE06322.1 single-stranded DNA-binding protein [Lysinibacillus sp. 2017]TGN35001.1 single-stranded DNA-binding protein [Lysinibacillus sp. S2017]
MNQVGLVGRITKDPALRQLSEERNQTSFTIAINRGFKNSQGMVDTDFIYCVMHGKLAEHIVKYCGKGSLIGVNGRIQTGSYINRENQKVYTTEVVVEAVRFYALKSPNQTTSTEPLENPMQTIPADFVLPEQMT